MPNIFITRPAEITALLELAARLSWLGTWCGLPATRLSGDESVRPLVGWVLDVSFPLLAHRLSTVFGL